MLLAHLSLTAFLTTLVSTAVGLKVISPGGSTLWWVANSNNTLVWDCSDKTHDQFNVFIANSDRKVLAAPLPIIAALPNYLCSKLILSTQLSVPAATGYTIQLTNTFNSNDIYAHSEPFEIQPVGSAFPDPSAIQGNGGASGSPGSNSHGSGTSNTTSGGNTGHNGGSKNTLSVLGVFTAILVGVVAT
ncbi:hypothetical protein BDM02DRAFT_3020743 [Thelephora ganbajun]|uniref:Uncharacterized protein n=1 Tax=Thelephora ganbajun TaxID=370292 RepID=A0ACB6ZA11_THEGA|nr:hypothetical protein BDM02DRAFT_3020743 [Thelephora ganbajun]